MVQSHSVCLFNDVQISLASSSVSETISINCESSYPLHIRRHRKPAQRLMTICSINFSSYPNLSGHYITRLLIPPYMSREEKGHIIIQQEKNFTEFIGLSCAKVFKQRQNVHVKKVFIPTTHSIRIIFFKTARFTQGWIYKQGQDQVSQARCGVLHPKTLQQANLWQWCLSLPRALSAEYMPLSMTVPKSLNFWKLRAGRQYQTLFFNLLLKLKENLYGMSTDEEGKASQKHKHIHPWKNSHEYQ